MKLKFGLKFLTLVILLGVVFSFSFIAFAVGNDPVEGVTKDGTTILISTNSIKSKYSVQENVYYNELTKVTNNHGWSVTSFSKDNLRKSIKKNIKSVEVRYILEDEAFEGISTYKNVPYVIIQLSDDSKIVKDEIFEVLYRTPKDLDKALRFNEYEVYYTYNQPFRFPADYAWFKNYNKSEVVDPELKIEAPSLGVTNATYVDGNLIKLKVTGNVKMSRMFTGHGWAVSSGPNIPDTKVKLDKKDIEYIEAIPIKESSGKINFSWIAIKLEDFEYIAKDDITEIVYRKPRDIDKAIKTIDDVLLTNISAKITNNLSVIAQPRLENVTLVSTSVLDNTYRIDLTFDNTQEFDQAFIDGWYITANTLNQLGKVQKEAVKVIDIHATGNMLTLTLDEKGSLIHSGLEFNVKYKAPRYKSLTTLNEKGLPVSGELTGNFEGDIFRVKIE